MHIELYAKDLVEQKRKYHSKVLSLDALGLLFDRVLDIESLFGEWMWQYLVMFINFDISSLFIWGLDPSELEPLNFDFDVELPSVEEWLQGIKIKFEKIDLGEQWKRVLEEYLHEIVPPKLDFSTFVEWNVEEEWQPPTQEQQKRKLIVGVTKYAEGYVDPPVIREFLRATFYELFKRRPDFERLYTVYKETIEKLGIAEHVAESTFNRIALLHNAMYENFILGYGILGISKLSPQGKYSSKVPVFTWKREYFEANYAKLAELQAGFILGITPLGLGLLMPRERFYKGTKIGTTPPWIWLVDWKGRRALNRFRATPPGIANYQKTDEMLDYHRSERVDQWHELQTIRYAVDSLVTELLKDKGIGAFELNLYRRAANQLIGHRKKRHRWGFGAFRSMSEEEFKEWWLGYWERQGLKREYLELIYERLSRVLPCLRDRAQELGERLKRVRYRVAKYLA